MRLFLGLPVPAEVAPALLAFARRVALPGGRYTTPENLHVTLYFLGKVADEAVPGLCNGLVHVRPGTFDLAVSKLGTFPRAGVLFAEIERIPQLVRLQREVAQAAAPWAARPDPNSPPLGEYHPHITLARTRGPLRLGERDLPRVAEPIRFKVDRVNLYQSRPGPAGSQYHILRAFA